MNAQDRHAAAAAKMADIEKRFNNLFHECENECKGMNTDAANKVYKEKYQSRYDALERLIDAAYICYWYTATDIPLHNKQVNHRATVARMRAAGLHRMATIKK